jgi:hypothetical protein
MAASGGAGLREKVAGYERAHAAAILEEFRTFLAVPNIASDTANIERNAELLAAMMRRRGIETRLLRVEGAPPVVFGDLRMAGAKKTIALYAHYDGQPVDRTRWAGDPWTPVMRTGLVERGGEEIAWKDAIAAPDQGAHRGDARGARCDAGVECHSRCQSEILL